MHLAIHPIQTQSNNLQNVDMRYNIRGQLLSINNSKLTSDGGVTNADNNDVFGMQLFYDQVSSNIGNTASFNGKVSAVSWMSRNYSNTKSPERSYKYSYDAVNRYSASNYAERDTLATGSFGNNIGGFDEYGITYDANGNLTALVRNSSTPGGTAHHEIDNLAYTYNGANSNQLTKVTDGTDTLHTDQGFRNLTGSTANYSWDPNGNLITDPYKGLSLGYNYLNRTDKITVTTGTNQYIDYTYDAGGNLIRKRQYNSSGIQTTTDYIDGFVYLTAGTGTASLSYFPMPEGRVLNNSGTFTQEFIITDQQGNARVSFQNIGGIAKVTQENSYYATGLIMANSPVSTPTTPNKQLYNGGSEWQNDYSNLPDYYQTFNRNYDAATGRFIGIDPQGESSESISVYAYAGNNPVMYNDPLGNLYKLWSPIVDPRPNPSNEQMDDPEFEASDAADIASYAQIIAENQGGTSINLSSLLNAATSIAQGLDGTDINSITFSIGQLTTLANALHAVDLENAANAAGGNAAGGNAAGGNAAVGNATGGNIGGEVVVNYYRDPEIPEWDANANQGGWPTFGKSDPTSWVFTTDRSNKNYQSAGVSGIDVRVLALGWDYVAFGHGTLPTLYFEYPKITNMFFKKNEVLDATFAALIMARATDRAKTQTEEWYEANKGMGDQWQIEAQFMKFLIQQVFKDGGRVSPVQNYSPVIVTPYKTL